MIEEGEYCSDVMKNHFNKELAITKKDDEDSENSTKCWICDNDYIDGDVKVRDHCHITGKYRGSAHRDCNIFILKTIYFILQNRFQSLHTSSSVAHIKRTVNIQISLGIYVAFYPYQRAHQSWLLDVGAFDQNNYHYS